MKCLIVLKQLVIKEEIVQLIKLQYLLLQRLFLAAVTIGCVFNRAATNTLWICRLLSGLIG